MVQSCFDAFDSIGTTLRARSYSLTTIASTGGRFVDFAPYVASISDNGVLAFQATLVDGHSGVFTSDGGSITDIDVTTTPASPMQAFVSHPDINRAGAVCIYAKMKNGEQALLLYADGKVASTGVPEQLAGIGPLGPTMNEQNEVGYRGTAPSGQAGIYLQRGSESLIVALAGETYRSFDGLPVVNNRGQVAFRVDMQDDRQGVVIYQAGRCDTVATTGDGFTEISRFPIVNDHGTVVFAANHQANGPGIFAVDADGTHCWVDAVTGFESFRGVLINNAELVAFYGTPIGGRLGIYAGPDAQQHRVLGLGDTLFDATVADFALNPVSVNESGQLAIRVALSDGRQFILRGDPLVV
jgi:hypothetical protein